jgi:hypothetical protein
MVMLRSPHSQRYDTRPDEGPSRQCKCKDSAVQRTVVKEGSNKGRVFWVCPKPQDTDTRCDFFEWDNEPPRSASGVGNVTAGTSEGGGQSNGECYKVMCIFSYVAVNIIYAYG